MAKRDLEKLKYDNVLKLKSGNGFTPQSLAFINASNRVVVCSGTNPNHFLKCSSSSYKDKGKCAKVGHANGATYCSKNDKIYVCTGNGNHNVWALNSSTYKLDFTIKLPTSASGIAYDKITNQFYVSSGENIYVYPYKALSNSGSYTGKYTHFKKQFMNDGRNHQDIGGYNGIVMVCRSAQGKKSQKSYIDCYDAKDGKYKKSYYATYGELESVAVDSNGNMHVLFATDRKLVKTKNIFFKLSGSSTSTQSNTEQKVSAKDNANKVIKKAEYYLGQGGDKFWEYGGLAKGQAWCACFIWCIMNMAGFSDCCFPKGTYYVPSCRAWLEKQKDFKRVYLYSDKNSSLSSIKKGDILITKDWSSTDQHICFARKDGTKESVVSIDGNWSGKVSSYTRKKGARYEVQCAFRPPYGLYATSTESTETDTDLVLQVSPDKLYSSDNYTYLPQTEEDDSTLNIQKKLQALFTNWNVEGFEPVPDTMVNSSIITASGYLDTAKHRKTKIDAEVFGPPMPISVNPVEAPFVELTVGGYTFGTFQDNRYDKYPNYINGMNVVRTNGSMNEYTINLVHQIRPGSNPNFIDELLSKNGYKKITIKYGDANSNICFIDSNALLIGVNVSFDFVNCNISYTLQATSSAISAASHKRTFSSVTDKPSNIIRELLYNDASEDLLNAFPRMRDKNFVENNNLIPNNDSVVSIEEFRDINVISYLKSLVASMTSIVDTIANSTYMLTIENGYFRINELSNSYNYVAILYEVDINFPDENQVFNFSVDTNYNWPIAYAYSGTVSNYNYEITSSGDISTFTTNSSNMVDYTSNMQTAIGDNWWKQVTEFPISAKLNCRGLLSPLLLLTYIKINCIYYGSDRINSGVYIVTGQEDSLSGSGYKTTLSLLRVSGPKQYISIDGRVKT